MPAVGQTLMDYCEENKIFNKWLRKQKLNPLAELYARHLYFNVGGWEAVHEWQSAQHGFAPRPLLAEGTQTENPESGGG